MLIIKLMVLPVALVVVHIIKMQIHRMPMGVQVQEEKVMLVVVLAVLIM